MSIAPLGGILAELVEVLGELRTLAGATRRIDLEHDLCRLLWPVGDCHHVSCFRRFGIEGGFDRLSGSACGAHPCRPALT